MRTIKTITYGMTFFLGGGLERRFLKPAFGRSSLGDSHQRWNAAESAT